MRVHDVAELFAYVFWLRDRALDESSKLALEAFLSPEIMAYRDLRATLVHELDVERSWRLRLQGQAKEYWDVTLVPEDYPDPAAIRDAWREEEAETTTWLAELTDDRLADPVTANGLEGYALATYLIHVVMHGVESFSAAAILLHHAGSSMGDVGFLDFTDAASEHAHP